MNRKQRLREKKKIVNNNIWFTQCTQHIYGDDEVLKSFIQKFVTLYFGNILVYETMKKIIFII